MTLDLTSRVIFYILNTRSTEAVCYADNIMGSTFKLSNPTGSTAQAYADTINMTMP